MVDTWRSDDGCSSQGTSLFGLLEDYGRERAFLSDLPGDYDLAAACPDLL